MRTINFEDTNFAINLDGTTTSYEIARKNSLDHKFKIFEKENCRSTRRIL